MIYFPKIYGLCAGASKALDAAYSLTGQTNAFVYKEILHNNEIMLDLKNRGINCVSTLDEVNKGDMLVIRAHGESKETFDLLKKKQVSYIDATCIKVKQIHDLVSEKYQSGYDIIIVGKKDHPEVVGTNGWCNNKGYIVETVSDISDLDIRNNKIYVIAQTTISEGYYLDIISLLKQKYPMLEFENTICSAPKLIQKYALELAKAMIL